MKATICKVLPENAYDYTACHIECWRGAYRGIIPDEYLAGVSADIEERTERLRKNLSELAGAFSYYYAAVDGKMIGRLIIGESRDDDKPDAGEIGAIYLLREYWGMGLGRQLMQFAIDTLQDMGYHEIILWALEENARALRFYEKAGFAFDCTKKGITIGKKPLVEVRYAMATGDEDRPQTS
jgi:GNAT superfamily N-acetyltransferase